MKLNEKVTAIRKLWSDLSKDTSCLTNIKIRKGKEENISFVNQYALHEFIPNKWFDWEKRVNSEIMVIGQDWGPYSALLPYIEKYKVTKDSPDFNYDEFLFNTFSSRTEKFIVKVVESSYNSAYKKPISMKAWNNFFFTLAVLFTRQGKHFRGNNSYDEKFGLEVSYPYLSRQIEIVKPKVIVTFGGTAFKQVNKHFDLRFSDKSITKIITDLGFEPIVVGNTKIIPNFHPASYTSPKLQEKIWSSLWKNI